MSYISKYFHIIVIFFLVILYTFKFNDVLFTPISVSEYSKKYSQSQYIMGGNAIEQISDSELYMHASYAYIRGEDPTTINFEHPPLVKYIYGFSYVLFKNQYLVNIFIYTALLYVFYIFSQTVLKLQKSKIIALIIFGSMPLLSELLQYALLDLWMVLATLILFILLYEKTAIKPIKKYTLIGIVLGIIASIKYPIPFILLPTSFILLNSILRKQIPHFIFGLFISVIIYLSQYIVYFLNNHTFIDYLKFEKFRFDWWVSNRTIPKFLIFSNLFLGKYKAWWVENTYQYTKEWNLGLPLLFLLHIYSFLKIRKNMWEYQLFAYSTLLLSLFALGSATELRYLLQIIPIWIIFCVKYIEDKKANIIQ